MGQVEAQPSLSYPFSLAAGQQLVDDALGGVAEVTELGLPDHQSIRIGHGIAQLKTEDTVLGEGTVADRVGSLVGIQIAKGPERMLMCKLEKIGINYVY